MRSIEWYTNYIHIHTWNQYQACACKKERERIKVKLIFFDKMLADWLYHHQFAFIESLFFHSSVDRIIKTLLKEMIRENNQQF